MRILHVVPSYLPATRYGGPIYSVHALARAQVRLGEDVVVFTTNVDGPGSSPVPLSEPVDRDGVKVWYFPCGVGRRLYRSPVMGGALQTQAGTFDVLHLHSVFLWPTTVAACVARRERIPYVIAPRGMLVDELIRRKGTLIKRAWIEIFERANIAHAAGIHVTSEVEKNELKALGLKSQRVFVIANGIDLPASAEVQTNAGRPYVLFLGRVNWKKGLDRLIPAMAYAPGIDLVVAGNDEEGYRPHLQEIANRHGVADRVKFVGPVDGAKKWSLIRGASVFTLPSYSENFGIAVLEAMACAVPIVVTPEVGLADEVEKAGAGLVVPGDPALLGEALASLLADPRGRSTMGQAGRQAAKIQFSWDVIAAEMKSCYKTCGASI